MTLIEQLIRQGVYDDHFARQQERARAMQEKILENYALDYGEFDIRVVRLLGFSFWVIEWNGPAIAKISRELWTTILGGEYKWDDIVYVGPYRLRARRLLTAGTHNLVEGTYIVEAVKQNRWFDRLRHIPWWLWYKILFLLG